MRGQPDQSGFDAAPGNDVRRLFFALWPDQSLRRRIERATHWLEARGVRGRRMAPDRYHLTLQFLGDFAGRPQSLIDAAEAAADSVCSAAFELSLDHAGHFGGGKVGWLGPTVMPAGLQQLWDALGLALASHGVHPKSAMPLTPHVTVLRSMPRPLPDMAIPPLSWSVGGFVLIESRQGDRGHSAYTQLHHWPLQQ